MKLLLPEIFDNMTKAATDNDRAAILRQYNNPVMQTLLKLNFHPDVKSNLPEGAPPYKKDTGIPIGYNETNLYVEGRRLYIFMEGNQHSTMPKVKRESLFISLLEGIHWREAEILCACKDKKLTELYPCVTEAVVRNAFPDMLPPLPPVVIEVPTLSTFLKETAPPKKSRKQEVSEVVDTPQE